MGKFKGFIDKIKDQGFLTGALTLAIAGILCRVIGIAFRIPLANIVGNYGMGIYQMVFPIYALLLVVSSSGIPVAISKMVARTKTEGKPEESRRILLNAVVLLGVVGLVVSAILVGVAYPVAQLQGNADATKIYFAVAPAIFLVCIISAIRGYFQGQSNMIPTATSQIVEQVTKVGVGILLVLLLIPHGVTWAVFGAIMAVTVSELVALVYLIGIYLWHLRKQGVRKPTVKSTKKLLSWSLMWEIIKKSVPITLMASLFPLILVFDSLIVIHFLELGGASNEVATQLYGISSGTVHTLINMPAVLGIAIGAAVVPMAASLLKKGKKEAVRGKAFLAIKLSIVMGLFFALFYVAFSERIITLLYERAFSGNPEQLRIASILLRIEAVMILLMGLTQIFTSLLQGAGKANYPLIALAIGGAVKVAFGLAFIHTPLGIFAVSIGNVLCFGIALALTIFFAFRFFKWKISFSWRAWRLTTLVLAYCGLLVLLALLMPTGKFWVLLSGTIAAAAYAFGVWAFKVFRKGELGNN